METLQPGLVSQAELDKIKAYRNANRTVTTGRRKALATIFGQESLATQGIRTDIGTTQLLLKGQVRTDEIRLVNSTRGCGMEDPEGNFLPNMEVLEPLGIGDIPRCCANTCRWGINGEGGQDTGCPRLETAIPAFLAYDELFRPEPIIEEFSTIKQSSFNWIKGQILKTKNDQDAYNLLAQECRDTGLPWYRYVFGIQHIGAYVGLPPYICHIENEIFSKKQIPRTGNLLDFACGEGTLTRKLARIPQALSIEGVKRPMFTNVVGLDRNELMLNAARKHHSNPNLEYINANISNPKFKMNMKFDAIVLNGISRYLSMRDTAELIAFCREVLIKNGRVYMSYTEITSDRVASSKYMSEIRKRFPTQFNTAMQISGHILKNSRNAANTIELAGSFGLEMNKFRQLANFKLDPNEYPTLDPNNTCICFVKRD